MYLVATTQDPLSVPEVSEVIIMSSYRHYLSGCIYNNSHCPLFQGFVLNSMYTKNYTLKCGTKFVGVGGGKLGGEGGEGRGEDSPYTKVSVGWGEASLLCYKEYLGKCM